MGGLVQTCDPGRVTSYLLDTSNHAELNRLHASSDLWDPFTLRRLDEIGVGEGWRCLEIGAGAGSVAAWLVGRVGASGSVVATDIETRWLHSIDATNLEVRHHNVVDDPLADGYDLIHARLVLEHLPQHEVVAGKLASALRPGGWLVVEDYDLRTIAVTDPPHREWTLTSAAVEQAMSAAGVDPHFGSRLLRLLRSVGLTDVGAEGSLRLASIPELATIFRPVLERLRQPLLASGALTVEQLEAALGLYDDIDRPHAAYTPILVSARGRRPDPSDAAAAAG